MPARLSAFRGLVQMVTQSQLPGVGVGVAGAVCNSKPRRQVLVGAWGRAREVFSLAFNFTKDIPTGAETDLALALTFRVVEIIIIVVILKIPVYPRWEWAAVGSCGFLAWGAG